MSLEILLYFVIMVIVFLYLRRAFWGFSIAHYSPAVAAEKLGDRTKTISLDVRTDGERKSGHIQGSIHIPLHQLSGRMDELRKHKDKEIICYCRSGNRSLSAAAKLKRAGFTVANLQGGIAEWNFQNLNK